MKKFDNLLRISQLFLYNMNTGTFAMALKYGSVHALD
ncbi:MAG: hypothetical protein ACI815_002503 [Psychroserpens sp.]|jgi:hypothetical protein